MNHVMIDLETLSLRSTASIVSIGAVEFNDDEMTGRFFKVNISPESCKQAGLHIDKETINWWSQQPKEAIRAWRENAVSLEDGLTQFSEFFLSGSKIWSYGASFDIPVLKNAFLTLDKKVPWIHWNEMCARTVYSLARLNVAELRKQSNLLHHDALADARFQTEILLDLFKKG